MVNFPTRIPDYESHSPVLLDLFLSSDTSVCCVMALPPLRNSDHVVFLFNDFPSKTKQVALFHHTTYDYSHADYDALGDHLRDVPWEDL